MLSALILTKRSYPAVQLAPQQVNQRFVQLGPLVLESGPLKLLTPTTDRDRTVSRRSEPSSRAILMGEQPNPWDLLQPQDMTSRHRGAKPLRRCELLGVISLLSPEYLLSFERWPFHAEHPYAIALCAWLPTILRVPLKASVTLLEATTPVKLPTKQCLLLGIRLQISKGWYFKVDSTNPGEPASQSPSYPTHYLSKVNVKL